MASGTCVRNAWIAAAAVGLFVWLMTSGFGPMHAFAGLFLALLTFGLLGALLVWLGCGGSVADWDDGQRVTYRSAPAPAAPTPATRSEAKPEAARPAAAPASPKPDAKAGGTSAPAAAVPVTLMAEPPAAPEPSGKAGQPAAAAGDGPSAAEKAPALKPAAKAAAEAAPAKTATADAQKPAARAPKPAAPATTEAAAPEAPSKPAAKAPKPAAGTTAEAPSPKAATAGEKPAPKAPKPAARTEAEAAPDAKPARPPRSRKPAPADDLKLLKGVGPKIESLLHDQGITRFAQIADWTEAEIDRFAESLGAFGGRIRSEDWVGQARILAAGGETDHSRQVRKDEG